MLKCFGFTLVELLVVVSIIAILLAMLTPALDRAVYQADLATCATKLDGIALAVTGYAAQFKRAYPRRVGAAWPMQVCNGASLDDRPLLREYLSINKTLRCPLSGQWDMENYGRDAANRLELTYSSYLMWFNMVYTSVPVTAMRRLGDRLKYGGAEFSILAHDSDVAGMGTTRATVFTAHQDDLQKEQEWTLRHSPYAPPGNITSGNHNYSFWWWRSATGRGTLDNNYAHDDGSVRRINGVPYIAGDDPATAEEAGMALLPMHPTDAHAWRNLVPTR